MEKNKKIRKVEKKCNQSKTQQFEWWHYFLHVRLAIPLKKFSKVSVDCVGLFEAKYSRED